jgi:hypothetical protein
MRHAETVCKSTASLINQQLTANPLGRIGLPNFGLFTAEYSAACSWRPKRRLGLLRPYADAQVECRLGGMAHAEAHNDRLRKFRPADKSGEDIATSQIDSFEMFVKTLI